MFTALRDVFHALADDIEEDRRPGETVKLYTAVAASPRVRPGDFQILEQVLRGDRSPWPGDPRGELTLTVPEAVSLLRSTSVTVGDLLHTFGPGWELAIVVARRAAVLTPGELERLASAMGLIDDNYPDVTDSISPTAAREVRACRAAARTATRDTHWELRLPRFDDAVAAAARAAHGAALAGYLGRPGVTQRLFETMMSPWVDVLGVGWTRGLWDM